MLDSINKSSLYSGKNLNTYNNRQLTKTEQLHQTRDYACLDHHFNALIGTIRQVRNSPAGISKNLHIITVQEADERGQDLLDGC